MMMWFILEGVLLLWQKFFKNFFKKVFAYSKTSLYLQSNYEGRVAQLVQSTWFTPKGSGVRIPSRPQKKVFFWRPFLFYNNSKTLSRAIPLDPFIKIVEFLISLKFNLKFSKEENFSILSFSLVILLKFSPIR